MKRFLSPTNIVAVVILLAGIFRLFVGGEEDGRLGKTTLLYFFGAAAVFLLSRAKTFKFGDLEIELEQLKEQVKEAQLVAIIAQDSAKVEYEANKESFSLQGKNNNYIPGSAEDDPWKGVFGGKSKDLKKGRALTAKVVALTSSPGWYSLALKVSMLPGAPLLTHEVQFYLHDTFRNDRPVIKVVNNEATLNLKAWGAFTVGAVSDDGTCELELDLAELQDAPDQFRSR